MLLSECKHDKGWWIPFNGNTQAQWRWAATVHKGWFIQSYSNYHYSLLKCLWNIRSIMMWLLQCWEQRTLGTCYEQMFINNFDRFVLQVWVWFSTRVASGETTKVAHRSPICVCTILMWSLFLSLSSMSSELSMCVCVGVWECGCVGVLRAKKRE